MAKLYIGGNTRPKKTGARIPRPPRKVALAYPVKGLKQAKIIEVSDVDTLIEQLGLKYEMSFRDSRGKQVKESISVNEHGDFALSAMVKKSQVVRKQQMELEFLQAFLEEWRDNPTFRDEFETIFQNAKQRKSIVSRLKKLKKIWNSSERREQFLDYIATTI